MEMHQFALKKSLKDPDEKRMFRSHGRLDVVQLDRNHVVGLGKFEPGWRWSQDVKPLAGTDSCQAEHFGYCLRGRMTIRMDDGDQIEISAGEAFYLAPGHDAWVEGDETCELLDFTGFKEYAVEKGQNRAA